MPQTIKSGGSSYDEPKPATTTRPARKNTEEPTAPAPSTDDKTLGTEKQPNEEDAWGSWGSNKDKKKKHATIVEEPEVQEGAHEDGSGRWTVIDEEAEEQGLPNLEGDDVWGFSTTKNKKKKKKGKTAVSEEPSVEPIVEELDQSGPAPPAPPALERKPTVSMEDAGSDNAKEKS